MAGPSWALVWGTRPELVKIASVVSALEQRGGRIQLFRTGQHTDLLLSTVDRPELAELVARSLDLRVVACPDPGVYADHVRMRVLDILGNLAPPPCGCIVQGDTASAYGAALGCQQLGIPVAHVEAGIRSGDCRDPYPEEGFRVGIDRIAAWHFAPTDHCQRNLEAEGILGTIQVTGNSGLDGLPPAEVGRIVPKPGAVLVTLHRRESWGRLDRIASALDEVALENPEYDFVWPLHPNPIIRRATEGLRGIRCIPAMGAAAFRDLLQFHVELVATDSGGVQEEAGWFGVPCLVLRRVTDRPESVTAGHAAVIGVQPEGVGLAIERELRTPSLKRVPFLGFGDGHAGERIAGALE